MKNAVNLESYIPVSLNYNVALLNPIVGTYLTILSHEFIVDENKGILSRVCCMSASFPQPHHSLLLMVLSQSFSDEERSEC
jgi:hypothetical protein